MDRRHLVLGLAVAASVATTPPMYDLYSGGSNSDEVAFTLDTETPERVWLITCTVDLPQEARTHPFSSSFGVRLVLTGASTPAPIEVVLWDAATFETLDDGVVAEADYLEDATSMDVSDAFADCLPGGCERTFFLYVSSPEDVDAAGQWEAIAAVSSEDVVDYKRDWTEVPVTIAYEELAF